MGQFGYCYIISEPWGDINSKPIMSFHFIRFCCLAITDILLNNFCCLNSGHKCFYKFLPEASFGLRVLSLPACVCVCLSVCQSLACPRDNSGPIQARITKFGPNMQKTLVKVPIVLWTNQPWPSRSNLTWKSKFTPFWACLHHNSPPIHSRITKFGPEVQNTLVKICIVLGGNWPWPLRSNMT